jgi:hypothetical protein
MTGMRNYFLCDEADCAISGDVFRTVEIMMDRLDRKILRLLQEDATLAVAEIAKKVGPVDNAVLAAHPEA